MILSYLTSHIPIHFPFCTHRREARPQTKESPVRPGFSGMEIVQLSLGRTHLHTQGLRNARRSCLLEAYLPVRVTTYERGLGSH